MVAVWATQLWATELIIAHGGVGAVSVGRISSHSKTFFPQTKSQNLSITIALSFQVIVQQKQ